MRNADVTPPRISGAGSYAPLLVSLHLWLLSGAGALHAQDPAPLSAHLAPGPGGLELGWTPAGEGWAYTLQAREWLDAGPWLPALSDVPWPTDETRVTVPMEAPAQFYRVLAVPRAERGLVLASSSLGSHSTTFINLMLRAADIPVTARYGVEVVKLLYETIDPWGGRIVASGVLALPQGAPEPLPVVSYQHGTVLATNDVPSADLTQRVPGIGFASQGYAAVMPDLLGLGDSPGFHPYHHARSAATAGVDLLRAVRAWCAEAGVELGAQLFLCGYSQGGHATMALHRELETHHPDEFEVTASAPMAGAHDLSGITLDDFLSGRELPNPYYVAYLLAAYQEVYQLFDDWSDWVLAPYAEELPVLLAARASGGAINDAMPADITQLLQPEILETLVSGADHPLRRALRANDVYRWLPRAPIRMFHCQGDADVPYLNSVRARDTMLGLGASEVEWIDPDPDAGHGGCTLPAFLAAVEWFEAVRLSLP